MSLIIFVIGRPGSGKTTFVRHLKSKIEERSDQFVHSLNDRDILLGMARRGQESRLIKATDNNNFAVIDDSVYDLAVQQLESKLRAVMKDGRILLVEFSRREYVKAFGVLDDLLSSCTFLILYLNTSFEICKKRNLERACVSNYRVPADEMESYFKDDDMEELALKYPGSVVCLDGCLRVEEMFESALIFKPLSID